MPLRVTDQTQWGHSPAGRRWAREDSGDLIGRGRQRSNLRGVRPPGARAFRLAAAPGSLTSPTISLWNELTILAHPPHTHVRKKLESRPGGTAVLNSTPTSLRLGQ